MNEIVVDGFKWEGYPLRMANKSTAVLEEEADALRLKRAKEALESYRQAEAEARAALSRAIDSTRNMKEKCEALFAENEKRACARRKDGRITTSSCY